jgi:4-hydroxy-tetrahydrodipicolinate synthase
VLKQRGLIASNHVRPPLVPPSEAAEARIKELLVEGEPYLSPTATSPRDVVRGAS